MNLACMAFILDGAGHYYPPLGIPIASFLAPIVVLICCCILVSNPRLLGYALAVAVLFTVAMVAPLGTAVINVYENDYTAFEVALFVFLVGFPILATLIFYRHLQHQPNPESSTSRRANDLTLQ